MLDDIQLKLLFGKPIDIINGTVHPLTIGEIVDMGENKYNQFLNILLYDVSDIKLTKKELDEMRIDKLTTYHFLLLQSYNNQEFKNSVIEALESFFKDTVIFNDEYILFFIGDKPIKLDDYDLIRKIIIKQNFLKELEEEENLIFGNDMAREWYMNLKKIEKTQPKPKSNMDLQSIISAVKWKGKRSFEEIEKMTVYQLYDGYYRLSIIDNCDHLNQGIYNGNVSQKDIKQSDLNWAKIIKFDNPD